MLSKSLNESHDAGRSDLGLGMLVSILGGSKPLESLEEFWPSPPDIRFNHARGPCSYVVQISGLAGS